MQYSIVTFCLSAIGFLPCMMRHTAALRPVTMFLLYRVGKGQGGDYAHLPSDVAAQFIAPFSARSVSGGQRCAMMSFNWSFRQSGHAHFPVILSLSKDLLSTQYAQGGASISRTRRVPPVEMTGKQIRSGMTGVTP